MSNLDDIDRREMGILLGKLQEEHAVLDQQVALITAQPVADQIYLSKLKKRKLQLKDMLTRLRSEMIPDQPA